MKFDKFLATFVVALLSACGGGSGGSTPAPAPAPAPAPILTPSGNASVTPSSCQIPAGLGKCTVNVTFATANATTASLTSGGGAVLSSSLSGSPVVDVLIGTNTYTLTVNGKVVASVTATGVCATGTTSNGTECVAPVSLWPLKAVAPTDTWVVGANQLSTECSSYTTQCWTDSIANGTVKAVASGVIDNGQPVIWLFFRNTTQFAGHNGFWNIIPVHANDGSLTSASPPGIWGGLANEIDKVRGSPKGIIYHVVYDPTGWCAEIDFSKGNLGVTGDHVPCPA